MAVGHGARRATDIPVLMASITDVARLAGVSTATVSRVVSAAPYAVSAATRARVLDAAQTLDYVPNALAQGMLKSRIPVVGVVVHDITDPYFSEVVRGVEDAARGAGSWSSSAARTGFAERERSYVRLLRSIRAADPHLRRQRTRRPGREPGDASGTCGDARPMAPRSSICRRMRPARPRSASTTPAASPPWSLSSLGSAIGRSPSLPVRPRSTSRASGWTGIAAASPPRASRSTSAWS